MIKEEAADDSEQMIHMNDIAQPESMVWIMNEDDEQQDDASSIEHQDSISEHQESPHEKKPAKSKSSSRDKKVCPVCGKAFTSWYLTIHLANHKEVVLKSKKTGKIKQIVNELKSARQGGESYIDAGGTSRQKRQVKPACEVTCHMKCFSKFSPEQRLDVHKAFWSLSDAQKIKFYNDHLSKKSIARHKQGEIIRKHNFTVRYHLTIDDKMEEVCRIMFINTLDISVHRIYYFMRKDEKSQVEYKHGKSKSRFIKEDDKDRIREHIRSIPCVEQNGEKYIVGFPHGRSLYVDYIRKHSKNISLSTYKKIFNTEFELSFQKNKKIREAGENGESSSNH